MKCQAETQDKPCIMRATFFVRVYFPLPGWGGSPVFAAEPNVEYPMCTLHTNITKRQAQNPEILLPMRIVTEPIPKPPKDSVTIPLPSQK